MVLTGASADWSVALVTVGTTPDGSPGNPDGQEGGWARANLIIGRALSGRGSSGKKPL
jgi:hypothetical protein